MRNRLGVIPSAARDLLFNGRALALCALGLVVASSSVAQAQEAVPLAHGNVPGEPHHHLKIENEYVRVYYVEVPPHENTQLHQHDHDYIYVSLGPADVVNAALNKPEIHLQLKDGETHFTRGGFAHVARNLADTPFRNITIELLKTQGEVRNLCVEIIPGTPLINCDSEARENERLKEGGSSVVPLFQTDEVTVSLNRLGPNTEQTSLTAFFGTVFVLLSGSGIQELVKGQPAEALAVGDVMWLLGGSITTLANPSRKAWSYLTVGGFKGSEPLHKTRFPLRSGLFEYTALFSPPPR